MVSRPPSATSRVGCFVWFFLPYIISFGAGRFGAKPAVPSPQLAQQLH
jgi:hypothetical protein